MSSTTTIRTNQVDEGIELPELFGGSARSQQVDTKKKCCFIDRIPGLNEAVYGLDYYSKTCRFEGCEVI